MSMTHTCVMPSSYSVPSGYTKYGAERRYAGVVLAQKF